MVKIDGTKITMTRGDTLIDLSGDTVASSADIVAGKIGHLNDGTQVTGTAVTGSQCSVTLTNSGDVSSAYIVYGASSHYTSGDAFYVDKNETITVVAQSGSTDRVYVNEELVASASWDAVRYVYSVTSDIEIRFSVSRTSAYVYITEISDISPLSITANGTYEASGDVRGYSPVTVNVPTGGSSSKNFQIAQGVDRVATTTYTAVTGQSITVAKTGTYDVYWTGYRSSTSGTSGSQLYVNDEAYGTAQTTFTNHGQSIHLSNVSLSQGDVVTVRARARNTSYFMYVSNMTIMEA